MKSLRLALAVLLLFLINDSYGQRYYNPIFTESSINISNNLVYGMNIDGQTLGVDTLKLDLYQPPSTDTVLKPLFIYAHTGSFLPVVANGAPTGDKSDSSCVNFCKLWAESGYVAASVNYRLGWNPIASGPTGQDIRTGTLLQAVYRAVLDLKNAVRFFKNSVQNGNNPYKIDTSKIIIFGQGSGGYLSLAYSTLDSFSKISSETKFISGQTGQPYVDTTLLGNLDGFGGSQNMDNFKGIDDHANFIVNMGGALADTSWLSAGQPPIVAFQCVRDPFAPYQSGTVIVPATNQPVVEVNGSGAFIPIVNRLGNNDTFANHNFNDSYTFAARSRYNLTIPYIYAPPLDTIYTGYGEGLMSFILPIDTGNNGLNNQASPWEFWNPNVYPATAFVTGSTTVTLNDASLASNPDMSAQKALRYIDSVNHYLLPRIMVAFALPGYQTAGIDNVISNTEISIYPNPASTVFNVVVKDAQYQMNTVNLYDITGKLVHAEEANNTAKYSMQTNNLNAGVYFLNIRFTNGTQSNAKIVIE